MRIAVAGSVGAALAAAAILAPNGARAELELPRESPAARVSQQVGLTEITVEYSSPAVKGRRLWGAVIPYDQPWAISPNQPTTVRFSKDVVVGDKPVAAGAYRLQAVPTRGQWTFLLTRTGEPATEGAADADPPPPIRVRAATRPAPYRERLTFIFSGFTDDKTTLDLEWDKLRVSLPIATNSTQEVLVGIGALDQSWRSYASAARFMLETKKDFDTGLRYADQSLALKEDWYTLWIKAALLAAKRDYKAAVVNGERAYALGQQQGDRFVLEPELKKAVADWRKRL